MVLKQPCDTTPCVRFVQANTAEHAPSEREGYWHEVVRNHIIDLECKAVSSKDFLCEMDGFSGKAGSATSVRVQRTLSVKRSRSAIDREPADGVILNLLLKGSMHVVQLDHGAMLEPGDFALCVGHHPYELEIPDSMAVACFRLPTTFIGCSSASLRRLVAQRFRGRKGMIPLVQACAVALHQQRLDIPSPAAILALKHLTMLVGAVVEETLGNITRSGTDHHELVLLRIKAHIASRLNDPDLSVQSIADALQVSPRYLHRLWDHEEETLANYFWSKRLDKVAEELRNPARRGESITRISTMWGFVNMSHLSRVFRDRFGLSPRDYRQLAKAPSDH
jgi:AraC-like DNA-binding protein